MSDDLQYRIWEELIAIRGLLEQIAPPPTEFIKLEKGI